jgi:hypothetical protein
MQPTSWKAVSLVLIGIILGCGANAIRGAQAQQPFAASANARPWQQYCQEADDPDALIGIVRAAGEQGFELATNSLRAMNSDDFIVCFKRPA